MKSKTIRAILRALIALLGAGIGVALTLGGVQLIHMGNPDITLPLGGLVAAYVGFALLFGVFFFLLSPRIIDLFADWGNAIIRHVDSVPISKLTPSVAGLVVGLIIAALISQILHFMGDSIFTVAFSSILYLVFGILGYTIGHHRSDELLQQFLHVFRFRGRTFRRKKGRRLKHAAAGEKLVDTSALIDGRLLPVCAAGFVEGTLVVPQGVVDELRRIADSDDPQRRAKGRRGLELLRSLQETASVRIEPDSGEGDVDVRLLRMARKRGAAVITGDFNLSKAAAVSGVRVLNLNELAQAMRPTVSAGDVLTIAIVKQGKEPQQGVGYLEDGTMVVCEGGHRHIGESVPVVVTSALQTSAGRMVFARVESEPRT